MYKTSATGRLYPFILRTSSTSQAIITHSDIMVFCSLRYHVRRWLFFYYTGGCVRSKLFVAAAWETTKEVPRGQSVNQACSTLCARKLQHTWCRLFLSCVSHVVQILLVVAFNAGHENKHRTSYCTALCAQTGAEGW